MLFPKPLFLLFVLGFQALGIASPLLNNQTYSATCSATTDTTEPVRCKLELGRSPTAMSWGRFDDTIETTGVAKLWISTTPSIVAKTAAFAAGFLEGALSAHRIFQQYSNLATKYNVLHPSHNLTAFLDTNRDWLNQQLAAHANDTYWSTIAWQVNQLEGLVAGYNDYGPKPLSHRQLEILQLQGDLSDIMARVEPALRPDPATMTEDELRTYTLRSTHCSALVKVAPDFSELFAGHNMWWGYYSMLAVVKSYRFPQQHAKWAAETVLFTSYPGILASTDDFYQLGSGLVVIETTNPNYNASSFDLIVPESVLYWQRVMTANYLANGGHDWMQTMSRYNSGTYNNMWMVVNYNLFEPFTIIKPDTLWVGEQAPGLFHAEDQSKTLTYGYWPSYNRALYPSTVAVIGQDEMIMKHGDYYSYQLYVRAEIFRRDQHLVKNEQSMKTILRYNQWRTDPLANHSACNQLACRGDLLPKPLADGAINGKFTTSRRFRRGEMLFIAGPTHQDQPVFQWSTAPPSVQAEPHMGQPDRFDFDWGVHRLSDDLII